MTAQAFTFHCDPGHGWLECTISASLSVGLCCDAYSRYSYRKADRLFLEEDCDAPKFIAAWRARFGADPVIVEKHTNSHSAIRRYERINP